MNVFCIQDGYELEGEQWWNAINQLFLSPQHLYVEILFANMMYSEVYSLEDDWVMRIEAS